MQKVSAVFWSVFVLIAGVTVGVGLKDGFGGLSEHLSGRED